MKDSLLVQLECDLLKAAIYQRHRDRDWSLGGLVRVLPGGIWKGVREQDRGR